MSPHRGQIAEREIRGAPLMFGSWRDSAECRGMDTMDFFQAEDGTAVRNTGTRRKAKNACARCEVREQCLAAAMQAEVGHHSRFGIWGGLTGPQRHVLAAHPERAAEFEPKTCLACTKRWFPVHRDAVACSDSCRADLERITRPEVA